jgi:phage gp36-like protein
MGYAVRDDLNLDDRRLAELTDSASASGVVNEVLVTRALDDGQAIIDGTLRGKYSLPLDPLDREVVLWNAAISRYFLYRRRETMPMPKEVADDYAGALAELERVVENKHELSAARVVAPTPPGPSGGALEPVVRHFGRGRDGLG